METTSNKNQQLIHNSSDSNSGFNRAKYREYQTLAKIRATGLFNCKSPEAHEMMEDFYLRLLPVTYRDWVHTQLKDNRAAF